MSFMRPFSVVFFILFSVVSFSQEVIKGWDNNNTYDVTDKQVVELVSQQLWQGFGWEDEGYSCGGNFRDFQFVSGTSNSFVLTFTADEVVDYCKTTNVVNSTVYLKKTNLGWEAFLTDDKLTDDK